jgi:hypothetical protein
MSEVRYILRQNCCTFDDELLVEKDVSTKLYTPEECCLFNADAAIALYTYLRDNLLEWAPNDIHTDYFENDDSGFIMIRYSGAVVWKDDGGSGDLVASFYRVKTTISSDQGNQKKTIVYL